MTAKKKASAAEPVLTETIEAQLRAALGWYADRDNYRPGGHQGEDQVASSTPVYADGGDRARRALTE